MAHGILRGTDELLHLATEMAGIAVWEYDFVTNTMTRSANHDGLYRHRPELDGAQARPACFITSAA